MSEQGAKALMPFVLSMMNCDHKLTRFEPWPTDKRWAIERCMCGHNRLIVGNKQAISEIQQQLTNDELLKEFDAKIDCGILIQLFGLPVRTK